MMSRRPATDANQSRQTKEWYLALFGLIVVSLVFGLIGLGTSEVPYDQFRWKAGLYLQISLTVLALLVVFIGQFRLRKMDDLNTARRYVERGREGALLAYGHAGILLILEAVANKAKSRGISKDEEEELDRAIAEFKRQRESQPGIETAARLMKRQALDTRLWKSLNFCLFVFILVVTFSIALIAGLEPVSDQTMVSDTLRIATLGTLNGLMIVGISSLGLLIHSALLSFTNVDPVRESSEEFLYELQLRNQVEIPEKTAFSTTSEADSSAGIANSKADAHDEPSS